MIDKSLFAELNNFSSSDESISEESELFESDIYPLRGDDFDKLKEQLNKTKEWNKEM